MDKVIPGRTDDGYMYMWHCTEHPAPWVYCGHGSLGRHASDVPCPKCVILFSDVMSLKGAVTSYMMSQHCMCIGHMTFYYKRPTNALVGGAGLLFIHSSGSTLSPETCMWLVPNTCKSRCI